MKILNTKSKTFKKKFDLLLQSKRGQSNISQNIVKKIINDVRKNGDISLIKYTKKFDKIKLTPSKIELNSKLINKKIAGLNSKIKKSIDLAFERITQFHKKQVFKGFKYKDKLGNQLGYKILPLEKVGVYVPGGTASYPSTLLMNSIPAIVAGVKSIYCVMPTPRGEINAGVLYAAKKCKIKSIFRIGGAQAIAALTYGTKKIPKVDKIVGPGNIFVATAKKEVFGTVGIDMVAGPSEITVIADDNNRADWTAIDLLSQAEHDILSQSILLTTSEKFAKKVSFEIKKILETLPRKKIASKSIKDFGCIVICKNKRELVEFANIIAPEHLEIKIKGAEKLEKQIKNAGSIFLGEFSPEAIGDYLAGPNHVLPTSGSARFASGLSVNDFLKRTSLIKCSKRGIEKIGQMAINLANYEGLHAHALSVSKRIKN
ncbi:MAG: histidinol dehydrogenase [Pelagibacteraceae bacterium]